MKRKTIGLVLTASMLLGTMMGGTCVQAAETKDVSELVIGEIQYSVMEDGGWAQAMHEGLVAACENLGIDTSTNLLTMEEISEEDPALLQAAVEELAYSGADIIIGAAA